METAMENEQRTTAARTRGIARLLLAAVWCVLPALAFVMGGPGSIAVVHADPSHLIRYQGQAVDSQGVPLEGPYTLTLRFYDAETAGTKIWEEAQPNVPLQGGHFSVLLGQVTPLNGMNWGVPCWLSVQVGTEPELGPRQRITSVPLAIRAEVAEGLVTQITTSTITDDANKLVPPGAIILWDGASCPAGYTRLAAYDDHFLVGSSTAGTTGGSNAHTHGAGSYGGPSHSHDVTIPRANWNWGPDDNFSLAASCNGCGGHNAKSVASDRTLTTTSAGAGAITGTSGSADSRPVFKTILLCKKDST